MDAAEAIAAVRRVLAEEPEARWAYVFGSTVRGGRYRDVDVAVMPTAKATLAGIGGWVARLETAVGCKVDLVDLTNAELPFVGPMLRERAVVVDRDPAARHAWEASTTSRWLDFEPSYREFLAVRERAARLRRERSA
ncbi:MAG: nucleotidyltransferase family protein [Planctomycetota bacterium]|jgi:predicted nucleotidyltransferase